MKDLYNREIHKEEMAMEMDSRFTHTNTNRDMLEKGAIVQRDRETYAIAPHLPGGLIDPDTMMKLAQVAKKYNAATLKVTNAQRIAIVGLKKDDVDKAWEDLGMKPGAAIGLCVRSIKFCPGTTFCKRGQQDSVAVGMELDKRYHGLALPGKFKIAVSGCANRCTDIAHRDVGIMGTPRGFNVYVGGTGGVIPREGNLLKEHCTDDEVFGLVDQIVSYYKNNARHNDRLGRLIDRIGFDVFSAEVMATETVLANTEVDTEFTSEIAGEVTSNLRSILSKLDEEFAEDIIEGGEMMRNFTEIPKNGKGTDTEFGLDFVEGFGADSSYTPEFVEGDRAEFNEEYATEFTQNFSGDSMATLKRDFAEGMSELEAGVDDLPYVSE